MSHRKPTRVKVLQGTFRKDRAARNEPTPKAGVPRRPDWLDAYGRAKWRQLAPLLDGIRVMTVADGDALALTCDAYARYRHATNALRAKGTTYSSATPAGGVIVRPRPEALMLDNAHRQYVAGLIQFGLTPASRSRVETRPWTDDDDEAHSFLFSTGEGYFKRDKLSRFIKPSRGA